MNYKKHYDLLINRGKERQLECYTESHHIVPKCMGGSDKKYNRVNLTPEEHYVAHQLLVKIYPDNSSLVNAATMMIPNRPSNKMYGWIKRRQSQVQSELQSGSKNSQFGKRYIFNKQLQECKKILKSDKIPDGWELGRIINWNNHIIKICPQCNKEHTNSKYCSRTCASIHTSKDRLYKGHSDEAKKKMSIAAKNRINNAKGTIWITDGLINKRVSINYNIVNNWKRGRT